MPQLGGSEGKVKVLGQGQDLSFPRVFQSNSTLNQANLLLTAKAAP